MKLEEALPHLREGRPIKRKHWPEGWIIRRLEADIADMGATWVDAAGILANDWEIFEEKRELSWAKIKQAILMNQRFFLPRGCRSEDVPKFDQTYLGDIKQQLGFK